MGTRAVECVLHGIDDRSVRLGAEAVKFDDPDKLLSYLRNVRNDRTVDRKVINKGPFNKNHDVTQPRTQLKIIRCLNCKQEGHMVAQCKLPLRKCNKCDKVGHETEQCFSKISAQDKSILQVVSDDIVHKSDPSVAKSNEKYFKQAIVNGKSVPAFIDLGSECSMIVFRI